MGSNWTRSPEWGSSVWEQDRCGNISFLSLSCPGPDNASQSLHYGSRRWLEELNSCGVFSSLTTRGRAEALTCSNFKRCVLFLQTCMTKCSSLVPTLWTVWESIVSPCLFTSHHKRSWEEDPGLWLTQPLILVIWRCTQTEKAGTAPFSSLCNHLLWGIITWLSDKLSVKSVAVCHWKELTTF